MSQSCNSLHLDGISLVKRVIEDTGGIDDLPSSILVISMSDEQRLGGESIWLNINVGLSHVVDQTRLTDVRVTCKDQSSGVGVNGRESSQMLPYLFQVAEG